MNTPLPPLPSQPHLSLQTHHRESPEQLLHCQIWELQHLWTQNSTEDSAPSWTFHQWAPVQAIFYSHSIYRASSILDDPSHSSGNLFSLLPSRRRFFSICSRTVRLGNPQVVRLLNITKYNPPPTAQAIGIKNSAHVALFISALTLQHTDTLIAPLLHSVMLTPESQNH